MPLIPFLIFLSVLFFPSSSRSSNSSLIVQEANYKDIYLLDREETVEFGNSRLSIRLSKQTGDWTMFTANGIIEDIISSEEAVPSIDFQIDGTWMINRYGASGLRIHFATNEVDDSAILLMTLGVSLRDTAPKGANPPPDFEFDCEYRLYPEWASLERRVVLRKTNAALPAKRLESFSFQIPGALIGDSRNCIVDVPGPFFPNTYIPAGTPYESLKDRDYHLHSAPDAGFGLVVISNPTRKMSLGSWMRTGGEAAYHTHLISDGLRITIRHVDRRAYRLDRSDELVSDIHCIELTPSLSGALSFYRDSAARVMPPEPSPPSWIKEMILLEVYPQYYEGGFKGIVQKLPFYKEIGFNTLYLMPHWTGGYSPIDLFAVDASYGTAEDLKELVRAAHRLGLRVLFDMVIHGFNKKSPLPQEHPEYFVHDEEGNLVLHNTWKSITCDWASPAYQHYMVDLVAHDIAEYDIDGYRVDAAAFKSPSWDSHIPYPAYKSGAAAPELLTKMLAFMRSAKPESVLLSEIFGPLYYSVCSLAHDNQTEAVQFLLEKMEKNEINASHYKRHMANVFDSLPPGLPRVFYSRNHDTSWFYHFNGYTPRFMAMEAIHALFAIPSVFAGDKKNVPNPDDDPATYAYYKKLFDFKKKNPVLIDGLPVLREVECDNPWVFAGIRRSDTQSVLIVVSLSDKPETARLTFPPSHFSKNATAASFSLFNVIQEIPINPQSLNRESGAMELKLDPFQVLAGHL